MEAFETISHEERVTFRFHGKEAVGDGVGRSVVSLFREEAMTQFDGEDERLPRITEKTELLVTVGKVIAYSFFHHGTFATCLAHGAMKNMSFLQQFACTPMANAPSSSSSSSMQSAAGNFYFGANSNPVFINCTFK